MDVEIPDSGLNRSLQAGEALVFSEGNFSGQEQLITADMPGLELNFPAASIRIGPKTGVTCSLRRITGGCPRRSPPIWLGLPVRGWGIKSPCRSKPGH